MNSIEFISKVKINAFSTISVQELKDQYLWGLPLTVKDQPIPDSVFQTAIDNATERVENLLNLKIRPQVIEETKDFYRDDWVHWSYVKSTYPVVVPLELVGYLGKVKQTVFPQPWLSARKTSDGKLYSRILYMVPTYGEQSNQNNSVVIYGLMPSINWYAPAGGAGQIPAYWTLKYITGFAKVPSDIKAAIAKIASIQILMGLSDSIMGNGAGNQTGIGWGMTSKSISIDGLSQSFSSGANQGIFKARIDSFTSQLGDTAGKNPGELQSLIDYYAGIIWITA